MMKAKAFLVSLAVNLSIALPIGATTLPFKLNCHEHQNAEDAQATFFENGSFLIRDSYNEKTYVGKYHLDDYPEAGKTNVMTLELSRGEWENYSTTGEGMFAWALSSSREFIIIIDALILNCSQQ
ncbi:MAG: hypothetical protein LBU89_07180 [Fibromonadaceae bacterium]|jgi:hypothetical protein|nr:hypothetical protein [Fibromonadaceae bacterium]